MMDSSSAIHIRPRTPGDDARLVEIRHVINHDRPPLSVEEFRHAIDTQPPGAFYEQVVADVDGRVVGEARLSRLFYLKEQSAYGTNVYVDREMWNRGIGSALWAYVLRRAREREATRIRTYIREDLASAQQFARKREFEPTGRANRMSRLVVASANLDRCRQASERAQQGGIRIATLAELGADDENLLRAIHEVDDESARDIPSSSEWDSYPFENWQAEVLEAPGISPDSFWVALDGEQPVGLALLEMRANGIADNAYTGVARRCRGRGVARALKLRTVEWAAQHGVQHIYTGNDVDNKAMLAINIDMGYEPLPAMVEFVRTAL